MSESNDGSGETREQESGQQESGQQTQGGCEPTGNPTVDSVLESLERLHHQPASEHVAVFESAHEKLRGALADAGSDDQTP